MSLSVKLNMLVLRLTAFEIKISFIVKQTIVFKKLKFDFYHDCKISVLNVCLFDTDCLFFSTKK